MKIIGLISIASLALFASVATAEAQSLAQTNRYDFGVSGYLRTGVGASRGGATQANFQMPGALNKYSLGNQADTYGELEFDYTQYLDSARRKSIDAVWMVSIYEPFGSKNSMSFNFTEQLYLRANNLFGRGESIWVGNRFYDRHAIYMLDRHWMNPGQKGWGAGVENLLDRGTSEDLKFAVWRLRNSGVVSFKNGLKGDLLNYTADLRWTDRPISPTMNLNLAVNYSLRARNSRLGYGAASGYGAFAWLDFADGSVTNTTAIILRQGANITTNHWSGVSVSENPDNDNLVTSNLRGAYSVELNNDYLFDNRDNFAVNVTTIFVARNYGTSPYYFESGVRNYIPDRGEMFYWASVGARGMYYVSKQFRPTLEYSVEYVDNRQLDVRGALQRFTFSPELSLDKGYYSRPVLRPFVTYAMWSDQLRGLVGTTPSGAPYGADRAGFNVGAQFEIWW